MRRLIYAVLCLGVVFAVGCGESVEGRLPVSGAVTYGGQPVEDGQIIFEPEAPGLRMATTQFKGGSYQIAAKDGPSPGPYRVRIEGYRKKPAPNMPPHPYLGDDQEQGFKTEQYLPLEYNAKTNLHVEITEEGENVHNFELAAKR